MVFANIPLKSSAKATRIMPMDRMRMVYCVVLPQSLCIPDLLIYASFRIVMVLENSLVSSILKFDETQS